MAAYESVDFPNVDREVLLPIEVNAPEAFWVTEERRGGNGQPYAVQTLLGWSLMSPRSIPGDDDEDETFTCTSATVQVNFVSRPTTTAEQRKEIRPTP